MSIHTVQLIGNSQVDRTIGVLYSGTDELKAGYAVCYDRANATADKRNAFVTKPSYSNYTDFAGIVSYSVAADSTGSTRVIKIIPFDGTIAHGISVWTDENVAAGDLLGVTPGEYALSRCVCGQPVAVATEAQDRSGTTAGTVLTYMGPISTLLARGDLEAKILRFFDHFIGDHGAATNGTAEVGAWLTALNSGTLVFADSLTVSDAAAANQAANGVYKLTAAASASEASFQQNGEPWSLAVGKNMFFRARFSTNAAGLTATATVALGLTIADTTPQGSSESDFLQVQTATGIPNVKYCKGTSTVQSFAAGAIMTADVFTEIAILVRVRSASAVDIHVWRDGVEVSSPTETATEIPTDQSLAFFASVVDSASGQPNIQIDRVEVVNYIG